MSCDWGACVLPDGMAYLCWDSSKRGGGGAAMREQERIAPNVPHSGKTHPRSDPGGRLSLNL